MEVRQFLYQLNTCANSPLNTKLRSRLTELSQFHQNLSLNSEQAEENQIEIPFYQGDNANVKSLIGSLCDERSIHSVILQGSLATNEEINYSDFDALIILKERAFETPQLLEKTLLRLQQLGKNIYRQDPIQHHGWFVTTEKLLNYHFDDFFPLEIFKHSVVLYPQCSSLSVQIGLVYNQEAYLRNLESTVNSIRQEIAGKQYLKNIYELKSTLSKLMLLPALYMQVKLGKGVYKKDSFFLASRDFTEEEWETILFASELRIRWNQKLPAWKRFLITINPSYSRKIAKRLAPKVPNVLSVELASKSDKMMTFAELILERAKAFNVESKT